jgi:quinol monooxygenase YgiN
MTHVTSAHFKEAQRTLPQHLVQTPRIVNVTTPQDGWSLLGEMAVPD